MPCADTNEPSAAPSRTPVARATRCCVPGHAVGCPARASIPARSGLIGIGSIADTLARPGFPTGYFPTVDAGPPARRRSNCPRTSRESRARHPAASMAACTRTCGHAQGWLRTCASSSNDQHRPRSPERRADRAAIRLVRICPRISSVVFLMNWCSNLSRGGCERRQSGPRWRLRSRPRLRVAVRSTARRSSGGPPPTGSAPRIRWPRGRPG